MGNGQRYPANRTVPVATGTPAGRHFATEILPALVAPHLSVFTRKLDDLSESYLTCTTISLLFYTPIEKTLEQLNELPLSTSAREAIAAWKESSKLGGSTPPEKFYSPRLSLFMRGTVKCAEIPALLAAYAQHISEASPSIEQSTNNFEFQFFLTMLRARMPLTSIVEKLVETSNAYRKQKWQQAKESLCKENKILVYAALSSPVCLLDLMVS